LLGGVEKKGFGTKLLPWGDNRLLHQHPPKQKGRKASKFKKRDERKSRDGRAGKTVSKNKGQR